MNYPSAKANGFPTQSTANSARNLSYVKAVGLDGGSRRSPVLIELESQNIHILESFQNHYYINGHSSHPLKQAGFLPAPKINILPSKIVFSFLGIIIPQNFLNVNFFMSNFLKKFYNIFQRFFTRFIKYQIRPMV